MSWRTQIGKLFGGTAKPKAKAAAPKKITPTDNPRAQAIAEARRVHRVQGAPLRAAIAKARDELARAGATTLRDPDAAARLMDLIHAQRAMGWLMGNDLRRFLVPVGVRQWLSEKKPDAVPKSRVVRR